MEREGLPDDDAVLGSAWLSDELTASSEWRHGAIRVLSATRIGADHGMSGLVHRVVADTERGGRLTFVLKQDSADAVDRELLFRRHGARTRGASGA